MAFAEALLKAEAAADAAPEAVRQAALAAAADNWFGNGFRDAYETLAFGGGGPFTEGFAELAQGLLAPLVNAVRTQRP